jgi:hypothetical protein
MSNVHPAIELSPDDKHYSVQKEQQSQESEVGGDSTAKMSFDCLQAAVPQLQDVQQISDRHTELKQQQKHMSIASYSPLNVSPLSFYF